MVAADTLPEMAAAARDSGDVEPLLERIRMGEAVMDAANGSDSLNRLVEAIKAYEERYGEVPATFVPDWG